MVIPSRFIREMPYLSNISHRKGQIGSFVRACLSLNVLIYSMDWASHGRSAWHSCNMQDFGCICFQVCISTFSFPAQSWETMQGLTCVCFKCVNKFSLKHTFWFGSQIAHWCVCARSGVNVFPNESVFPFSLGFDLLSCRCSALSFRSHTGVCAHVLV